MASILPKTTKGPTSYNRIAFEDQADRPIVYDLDIAKRKPLLRNTLMQLDSLPTEMSTVSRMTRGEETIK